MNDIPTRVIDRVLRRCRREGDCLVSTYSAGSHGYCQVGWKVNGRTITTLCHRVAWIAAHGPIPDAMTIDHVCRNRHCIEVSHLRLLTNVDNAKLNGSAIKTHCVRGHEFTPTNTRINRSGHRYCRACQRIRDAAPAT